MSLLEPSVLTIKARGTEGTGTQVTGTGPLSVGLQPTPQAWRDLTCLHPQGGLGGLAVFTGRVGRCHQSCHTTAWEKSCVLNADPVYGPCSCRYLSVPGAEVQAALLPSSPNPACTRPPGPRTAGLPPLPRFSGSPNHFFSAHFLCSVVPLGLMA